MQEDFATMVGQYLPPPTPRKRAPRKEGKRPTIGELASIKADLEELRRKLSH